MLENSHHALNEKNPASSFISRGAVPVMAEPKTRGRNGILRGRAGGGEQRM